MALSLAILAFALLSINLASIIIAIGRLSHRRRQQPSVAAEFPVSIVVPVRGVEAYSDLTLRRAFELRWRDYELIFCVQVEDDPIIARIRDVMAAYPHVPASILIGDDRISANPKLNNCAKGWHAARHEWVILADSNVLMPPDYVGNLVAGWRKDTGLVCSTPIGARPDGFWAEVECAFLNTLQARWQYVGEALGLGFAQGKSMLWHKPFLDAAGGIAALAAEIAEDAAATKLVNRYGKKVHLVAVPFEQPLGRRSLSELWSRQARWARLRRVTFPMFFAPEILLGALPPLLLGLGAAFILGVSLPLVAATVACAIYLPEIVLAASKGWRLSLWSLPAMIARDLLLPAIWMRSWVGGTVEWRGNAMTIGTQESSLSSSRAA